MVYGELDVLRQQVEPPAAGLVQDPLGEQEARPAHGGAGAQPHPGPVEIAALPQEPQAVAGADPVVGVVLAVAVAGDDLIPAGEHGVHLLDVVRSQYVVGVEHEVAVKAIGIVGLDVLDQEIQGVALTHVDVVEPLVHHGAVPPCDGSGVVGAVVRRHEYRHKRHVIGLRPETVQQAGDDVLLVPGGDQHRVAVGPCRRGKGLGLFCQHQRDIEELIGIADKKQRRDNGVDGAQRGLHKGTSFLLFLPSIDKGLPLSIDGTFMVTNAGLRNNQGEV